MTQRLKAQISRLKEKFLSALPVIVFFLFLFYTVIVFFGMQYVLLASVITISFKMNYRKRLSAYKLATSIAIQFLMAGLAFLATRNLFLCVLLNLSVPFALVFLQTSQFNQLGYYSSAMCFAFLQMRPVDLPQFGIQLLVMLYGMALLAAAVFGYSRRHRRAQSFEQEKRGLLLLAEGVRRYAEGKDAQAAASRIFAVVQELYKGAYQSRGLTYMVTGAGRTKYMFATLFQQAVYYLTDPYRKTELSEEERGLLRDLADYMEGAGKDGFGQERLLPAAKELLAEASQKENDAGLLVQNFLQLFLLILENWEQSENQKPHREWKLPKSQKPVRRVLRSIRSDCFERRFALRLAAVLTVGFVYSMASQANHGYWLALNAFLLLRPTYEDSVYRLKNRLIGTLAGCLLLPVLLLVFPGTAARLVLSGFLMAGLYMEMPGTWTQALFSTTYALTIATMVIPEPVAIGLRFAYVVAAALLVFLLNRFFFPFNGKRQFWHNIKLLLHVQNTYLEMMERSLTETLNYGDISDLQIRYHLIHDQIVEYLDRPGTGVDAAGCREFLRISWRMASEAAQMLMLLGRREEGAPDTRQMEAYLTAISHVLRAIQQQLHIKSKQAEPIAPMPYWKTMDSMPRMSALMVRYAKQASGLYRLVCSHTAFPQSPHAVLRKPPPGNVQKGSKP